MIDPGKEPYLSRATFRKKGNEVKTPVWIAAAGEERAYVYTNITSGRARRIPRLAPGDCHSPNVSTDA